MGYILTYLLTPWCRVLLEKLTGLQLDKKFPAFHRTRRFITALTSFRHLSLSWAHPIQSIYPHPTSWRSTLILSTHLRLGLPSVLLPSGFPTKTLYTPSPHPYTPHAQPISFFSILSPAQYLNGLHGHTNTPSLHSYFLWPLSSTRQIGCKHTASSVKFSDIQCSVQWMPEEPVKRSSTVLVPINFRAVGTHKQLYISQVSSGTHHVAGNSASPTLLVLCRSLPA